MKNTSKIIINRIKLYKRKNANAQTIIVISKLKLNKNKIKKFFNNNILITHQINKKVPLILKIKNN